MPSKTLKPSDPALLLARSVPLSAAASGLGKPRFRLPSQRYPNMVTSNSVNRIERCGLIIDILA